MNPTLTCASASAPVAIFKLGCSFIPPSLPTRHISDLQTSNGQQPGTSAIRVFFPLSETPLTCHLPAKCSITVVGSKRFLYRTRPSELFSPVGSKNPLMNIEFLPVAPLMKMASALELSAATAAACSAACKQRNPKQSVTKLGRE